MKQLSHTYGSRFERRAARIATLPHLQEKATRKAALPYRRAARKAARKAAPSEPHDAVASPPAKDAVVCLIRPVAKASSAPPRLATSPPRAVSAGAPSSSVVAGVTRASRKAALPHLKGQATRKAALRHRRSAREATRKAAPSEPHDAVASPLAKDAVVCLIRPVAKASFVPPRLATSPPRAVFAGAPSSSVVAGVTRVPAKRLYPADSFANPRPVVVPPKKRALADASSSSINPYPRIVPPPRSWPAPAVVRRRSRTPRSRGQTSDPSGDIALQKVGSQLKGTTMSRGTAGGRNVAVVVPPPMAAVAKSSGSFDERPMNRAKFISSCTTCAGVSEEEILRYNDEGMRENLHGGGSPFGDDGAVDEVRPVTAVKLRNLKDCADRDLMFDLRRYDADLKAVRSLYGFRDALSREYFVKWMLKILVEAHDKEVNCKEDEDRSGDLAVYHRTVCALHDVCCRDVQKPPHHRISEMIVDTEACVRKNARRDVPPVYPRNVEIPSAFNKSQRKAAANAFSEPISIVQGPPGTGKTGVAAVILQGWSVLNPGECCSLATSFTNTAVDNIAKGLIDKDCINVFRAGRTDKMCEDLWSYSMASGSEGMQQLRDGDVVCATALSAMRGVLDRVWPCVLIDEAALATEPATLVALCHGAKRAVLVGDHQQMPPTVSHAGCQVGLHVSLFERLLRAGCPSTFLNTQYRMHPGLSCFPMSFYLEKIHNGPSTLSREIPSGRLWPNRTVPVCVVHVDAQEESEGSSVKNYGEAEAVRALLQDSEDIIGVPLSKKSIAVITTYSGQVALVRDRTGGVVDVYTIDKSQGQERDVIILSMVRSNAKGHLGFITDRRRINVALTRARDGLIIVCNTRMLLADKRTWYSYLLWAKSQQVILTFTSGYNVKALTSYDMGGVATS